MPLKEKFILANVPPYAKLRRPRGGIICAERNRLSGQAIWVNPERRPRVSKANRGGGVEGGTAYVVLGGVPFLNKFYHNPSTIEIPCIYKVFCNNFCYFWLMLVDFC